MPWMVYLKTEYQFRNKTQFGASTGSLISPRHVLTCAHCPRYNAMRQNDTVTVVYGSANKNEGHQIMVNKSAVHIHPNFRSFPPPTFRDMAIVDVG